MKKTLRKWCGVTILAVSIFGFSEGVGAEGVQMFKEPPFEAYKVSESDSFYFIAQRYGLDYKKLMELNPNIDPLNLQVDSIIRLKAPIPTKNWETVADKVIATGMKYIGVEYNVGADYERDGSMKFDCSSFTEQIFEVNGFSMWGESRTQFLYDGNKQLTRSELRKGDLIFFTTIGNYEKYSKGDYRRNGHVGVVKNILPDGSVEVLHTYKVGVGVTVTTMKSDKLDYWSKAFLYGKRVINDDGTEATDVTMPKTNLVEGK